MFSLHIFSSLLKGAENTVGFVLMTLVRTLFYHLCGLIYWGLRGFCNVFFALCNGQLLDTETLNSLFGRVGLLLGVIMMFRVAFSFIQVLISPDAFSDPEKGIPNIIKKSIIVIIMFGMSSYVFSFLRTLQGEIIESNVISKFLLPQQVETDNFGGAIEAELFTAFYNLDPSLNYDTSNECATEDYINGLKNEIAENNSFDYKTECVNEAGKIKDTDDKQFFIKFNFIFSILIGIVACYFFINYCISVGVRVIQLAFLQIISPMAIVGYLSPNKGDNMFNKWLKVYFSTYIDVFLRMAIINFAIYLIAILIEGYNNADSVFFAAKLGRSKAIMSKIYAGIGTITAVYWFEVILFTLIVLATLGINGANCLIQTDADNWHSIYNITFFQEYLITVVGAYIGCIFILSLSMLVSIHTKQGIVAITIPFFFVCVCPFLGRIPILSEAVNLLPGQLLQLNTLFKYIYLYCINGRVVGLIELVVLIYFVGNLFVIPRLYFSMRRTR